MSWREVDVYRFVAIALALIVAACASSPPAATSQPTVRVTVDPGYTDEEKEALAAENIDVVYCGSRPFASWCEYLALVDGKPDIAVDGTSLFIAVKRRTPTRQAERLCRDLAIASFDDNAEPIGYLHVHVQAGPNDFRADCDVS
jgi:hypothetical protein